MFYLIALIALQLKPETEAVSTGKFSISVSEFIVTSCETDMAQRWRNVCYETMYDRISKVFFDEIFYNVEKFFNEPPDSPHVRNLNYECCEIGCSDNWIYYWYCKKPPTYHDPLARIEAEPPDCYNSKRNCYSRDRECHEYYGSKNTTLSGLPCQYWNSQTPHTQNWEPFTHSSDRNYCRRFNSTKPWCYISEGNKVWEFCFNLCECYNSEADCYSQYENCEEYQGTKSTTLDGDTCQIWSSQSPHSHNFGPFDAHNYCRTIGNSSIKTPGCITTSPDRILGACFKLCESGCYNPVTNCYINTPGCYDYAGTKATTVSGKQCQAWSDQSPHTHIIYADQDKNKNYCRRHTLHVPWCFTTVSYARWEPCFFHCGQLEAVATVNKLYTDCFHAGLFYYAFWRNNAYGLVNKTTASSELGCYQDCRTSPGCNYWSFLKVQTSNNPPGCYLRKYQGGSLRWINAISGPSICENTNDKYRSPDHNCIPFGNYNEYFIIHEDRRLSVPAPVFPGSEPFVPPKLIEFKPWVERDNNQLKILQVKLRVFGKFSLYLFPDVSDSVKHNIHVPRDIKHDIYNGIFVDIDFSNSSRDRTITVYTKTTGIVNSDRVVHISWRYGSFGKGEIDEILIRFLRDKISIFVHGIGKTREENYHVDSSHPNPSWIYDLSYIWSWSDAESGTRIINLFQCTNGVAIDHVFDNDYMTNLQPNFTIGIPPININYVAFYGFMSGDTTGWVDINFHSDNINTVLTLTIRYENREFKILRNAVINGQPGEVEDYMYKDINDIIFSSPNTGVERFMRIEVMFLRQWANIAIMGRHACLFMYRNGFTRQHIVAISVVAGRNKYVPIGTQLVTEITDPERLKNAARFTLFGIDLQNAEYDDKTTKIIVTTPELGGNIRYLNYTPIVTSKPEIKENIFISNHEATNCFEHGTFFYKWWDEEKENEEANQIDTVDHFECFRMCRRTSSCQFWSFVVNSNQGIGRGCYLRKSKPGSMRFLQAVSGPKDCRNPGCPFGWLQAGDNCYYLLPDQYTNQSAATRDCRAIAIEASLPVFRNRAEFTDFDDIFLPRNAKASLRQMWLAGNDDAIDGEFVFQQAPDRRCGNMFLNFGPGQPDGHIFTNCLMKMPEGDEFNDVSCYLRPPPTTVIATVCQLRGTSFCDKQDYKLAPPISSCEVMFNQNPQFNHLNYKARNLYAFGVMMRNWNYKDAPKMIPFKPQLADNKQLNMLQINAWVGNAMTIVLMPHANLDNKTVELIKQDRYEEAFKNYIRIDLNMGEDFGRSMVLRTVTAGVQTEIKKITKWTVGNVIKANQVHDVLIRFLEDKIKIYIHGDDRYFKIIPPWRRHDYMMEIFELNKPSWFDKMENIWFTGSPFTYIYTLFHCTSGMVPEQNQSHEFTYDLGKHFRPGRSGVSPLEANYVALYGFPSGGSEGSFQVHFLPANDPDLNTIFRFSVNFWRNGANVGRNARRNGYWGEEEKDLDKDIKEFPFMTESYGNQNFTRMDFMFKESTINVAVNGFLLCTFKYRHGANRQDVKTLMIDKEWKNNINSIIDEKIGYELFGIDVKYVEYKETEE